MSTAAQPATDMVRPYDDAIVKKFVVAVLVWGVVGMTVGVWLAAELAYRP
jgi:cbb3-type cytochrome oxidase subunit 1